MKRSKLLGMGSHEGIVQTYGSSKTNPVAVCMFVLLLLLTCGEAVSATTYYVSPTGSDGSSGSTSAPFRTIQKAASKVNPGDTVIVKDGTYTDTDGNDKVVNITRGGNAGNWITFKSENKWGAKVDCRDNVTGYGINIGSVGYISIEDFDISGCKWGAIWSNMSGHDIYVYRNRIHDIGRWDGCPNYLYGRCGVYQGQGTSYHAYDSNVFYTIGRLPAGTPDGTCEKHFYQHDHGIYLWDSYNSLIMNNSFYDLKAGWSVAADNNTNVTIVNNTMATDRPGSGGHITVGGSGNTVNIQNNVFYDPGTHSGVINDLSYWYGNPPAGGITIKNNITNRVYSGATTADRWITPVTGGYNAASFSFSNNLELDIQLADPANYDFHLLAASPAIDAGIPYPERVMDADGTAISGNPDIGAYEYGGGTAADPQPIETPIGDTTPPSTPSGLTAVPISSAQINLSWPASTDNIGVAGYNVFRNGTQISSTTGTSYADAGLTPSTTYTYSVSAYDAAGNTSPQSGSVSAVTQGTTQTRSPYPGPGPASVPGIVEAEHFDSGGEGVSYHDTTSSNEGGAYRSTGVDIETCSEGGYNVGWIHAGEWLEYTINVAVAGTYDIEVRTAAASGFGGKFHIEFDGTDKTGTLSVSPTGGWQSWATVRKSGVSLSAGQQVMRIVFDTETGGAVGNINYISIASSTAPTNPVDTTSPSTPSALKASVASSTQINLSWAASADNVGVAGYRVYRNGTQIATTADTSYADAGLTPSTTYTYAISAYDAAGNNSPQSDSVSATTSSTSDGGGQTRFNITVNTSGLSGVTIAVKDTNRKTVAFGTTDTGGQYITSSNLKAGTYSVTAYKHNYTFGAPNPRSVTLGPDATVNFTHTP